MAGEVKGGPLQKSKLGFNVEYLYILFLGTVRRFLEIHGETIEKVVFAVSELEEVFY